MRDNFSRNLVIRADSSTQIGVGHIMRCIALAQRWQAEGGCAIFLSYCESQDLRRRIQASGIRYIPLQSPDPNLADLNRTLRLLPEIQPSWLVLDGYHFSPSYQKSIRAAGYKLMVIDDVACWSEYHADILLNQNINAGNLTYKCDSDTRVLVGPRYVLLRPEFFPWRTWQRHIPEVAHKVLVSLGGSDQNKVIIRVIHSLKKAHLSGLKAKVVLGPASPWLATLGRIIDVSTDQIELLHNADNMADLMAWADMALCGAGITCWELSFMGLPSALFVLSENQRDNAMELDKLGISVNLGWHKEVTQSQMLQTLSHLSLSAGLRFRMANQGRNLVDGYGVDRVLMHLRGQKVWLRHALEHDAQIVWEWANDPVVRELSFSSNYIPWENHIEWFKSKLNSSDCVFLIVQNETDTPIGQVRYDLDNGEAVISISIDTGFRGKGYGSSAIELACLRVFQIPDIRIIHSYIKAGNEQSVKAFLRAGFEVIESTRVNGEEAIHLVMRRNCINDRSNYN